MSARDRRAATLGSAILVPALLFALVAQPYARSVGERRAQIREQRMLLARETGLIDVVRRGGLQTAAREAAAFTQRHVLIAADETLLYARASAYLESLAQISTAQLEDAAVVSNETTEDGLRVVVLSLRGHGMLDGVLRFIHLLENGPAVASIDRLQIVPLDSNSSASLSFGMDVRIYGSEMTP
ncbi:MAG: hypothetical protein ACT4O1_01740 [Gemmatimonadota bacterium]